MLNDAAKQMLALQRIVYLPLYLPSSSAKMIYLLLTFR